MKAGLQMKMKRGKMVGQKAPYGYKYDSKKTLIIKENETRVVKRIFEEYANKKDSSTIANGLNADGILSPTKTKWCKETVRKIVLNEKYVGNIPPEAKYKSIFIPIYMQRDLINI